MLREFFLDRKNAAVAWTGCAFVLAHAFFRAWQKRRFNSFFGSFYDFAGSASESASGPQQEAQRHMRSLLVEFSLLCVPSVVLHPLFSLLRNFWLLSWRIALINSYLGRWSESLTVENAAQRVHEDTQRFTKGLASVVAALLDSAMTLVVFVPILVEIGESVNPLEMHRSWLALLALGVAAAGVVISVCLGSSLVGLEVANQIVEADLRKRLVLLEAEYLDAENPLSSFNTVISRLWSNYAKLYARFGAFAVWLNLFEQGVQILPYVAVAPLLFATGERRISLGVLTRTTDCFGHVFSALNIVSDNWLALTEFLSVIRRLRQFERALDEGQCVSSSRGPQELQNMQLD